MAYVASTNLVGPNTGFNQAAYLASLGGVWGVGQGGQGYSPFGAPAPWESGGGGGAGGGASPYDLPTQYLNAYNEAKQSNEDRYNSILGGYQDRLNVGMTNQIGAQGDILDGYENRYQRGMNNLQGMGDQQKKDTSQAYDNLQSEQRQQLTSRGLTGSTILPTMQQGVERQRQDALNRVNEQLQRERLNYDASLSGDALSAQERQYGLTNSMYGQLTGDTLQFAERRSDTYPDFNQLASLAQAYGAGGGSYGAGGMSDMGFNYVSPQRLGYQIPGQGGFGNFVQPWWGQPNGFEANGAAGVNGFGGNDFEANGAPGVNRGRAAPGPMVDPRWGGWGAGGSAAAFVNPFTGMATPGYTYDAEGNITSYPNDGGVPGGANLGSGIDPSIARNFALPTLQTYQHVVNFLGREPQSKEEVDDALEAMMLLNQYA